MTNIIFTANIIGILSLISAIAFVYSGLVDVFKANIKHQQLITFFSPRWGLFSTISLGLIHGLLTTQKSNIDFYNFNTYWIYAGGVFLFNLFVFLGFTFSQFKTEPKKLNYFNYAILFLLVCHVGQKMIF